MPRYDTVQFSPHAPIAEVTLRDLQNGSTQSGVPMLIDSGADITMLPRTAVESLKIGLGGQTYEAMGFDGSVAVCESVYAEMTFAGARFKGQFLIIDNPIGVLGRPGAEHSQSSGRYFILDGPNLNWEAT